MQIQYSEHLENRLKTRKIQYDLPRKIYEQSKERYFDNETKHHIAIMQVDLYGKMREVMVAYALQNDFARLLTIHPLKAGQKQARLESGRWRKM
jgi:hypothetical protein